MAMKKKNKKADDSFVYTEFKDYFGKPIYEGDYVTIIKSNANSNDCGRVGRVIWDQRRNEWQVITMILPSSIIRPECWGRAVADWLNECTAKNYEVINHCFIDCYGDWQPKTFWSGGIEIPLTKKADNAVYKPAGEK